MKARNTKFRRLVPFPLADLRILSACSCCCDFSMHLFTNFRPFLHSRALSGSRFNRHVFLSCWRVQCQSCNFLCMFVRMFIGPTVSFWSKWAPTSVSGYRIMRPLRFGGPGSCVGWFAGWFADPYSCLSDRNHISQIWPLDAHLRAYSVAWKKSISQAPEI